MTGAKKNLNAPIIAGEWSLATGFNASDDFLKQYGDAQKTLFTQSAAAKGWIFWAWKVEHGVRSYPIPGQYVQWGYRDALAAGVLTTQPGDVFDKDACKVCLIVFCRGHVF